MKWPGAQCFAAYNPASNKNEKGRWAGATGVHCTSSDFANLYKRQCRRNPKD